MFIQMNVAEKSPKYFNEVRISIVYALEQNESSSTDFIVDKLVHMNFSWNKVQ